MFGLTFAFAVGIAAAVAFPWALARKIPALVVSFIVNFILAFVLVFLTLPTTAGPLFGEVGGIASLLLIVNAIAVLIGGDEGKGWAFGAGAIALVANLGLMFIYSPIMSAMSYGRLVGEVEERKWDEDFQPKDPRHFRVSSAENAEMLSARAMGQATTLDATGQPNSIGSQFQVNSGVSSIQLINNELWTVVPIDWSGWGPQWDARTPGVPGYIKVSGENPVLPAHFERLKSGQELQYTPRAIWGKNLDRLVWSYHSDKIIADTHLELDDEQKPHYVVSLASPTIGWYGERVVGALVIDPVTGSGVEKFIPLKDVPHWVDRVEAMHLVHRNIDYHGKYKNGLMNRTIYGNSVLAATETHFGYGSDGEPILQTGITAHNTNKDNTKPDSLVAVYYTNTRTGKTTEYMLQGGATEQSAINQCNLIGDVRNKQYHATTPQLYNVLGHLSYVAPIQNASHAFAGVCVVDVMNVQVIAWAPSAHEAELAFKQVVVNGNTQLAIEGTGQKSQIAAKVTRMGAQMVNGLITYSMMLEGFPHLFTVPTSASNEVPVTQVGDRVSIEYIASDEEVLPIYKFDNLDIGLQMSPNEEDVRSRATAAVDAVRNPSDDTRLKALLDKLSPSERALLERVKKDK